MGCVGHIRIEFLVAKDQILVFPVCYMPFPGCHCLSFIVTPTISLVSGLPPVFYSSVSLDKHFNVSFNRKEASFTRFEKRLHSQADRELVGPLVFIVLSPTKTIASRQPTCWD